MYTNSEIEKHAYEISLVSVQRMDKPIQYVPLNTLPHGMPRIQYLQQIADLANAMQHEVGVYEPLFSIISELEEARDENARLRSKVASEFVSHIEQNRSLLTARLSPAGRRLVAIKREFFETTRGLIRSWQSGPALTNIYESRFLPMIIDEVNSAYFHAVQADEFSLSTLFRDAINQLHILNPDLCEPGPFAIEAIDVTRHLQRLSEELSGEFETLRLKTVGQRLLKTAGFAVLGAFAGSVVPGIGNVIGIAIAGAIGAGINIRGMYSDLAKQRETEWGRIVDRDMLPLFRQYVLAEYRLIEVKLTNSVKAAAQPIHLSGDPTYEEVRSTQQIFESGVVSHKAHVIDFALRREYAATINELITEGSIMMDSEKPLDTYFERVESCANPRNAVAIGSIVTAGRQWLSEQSEKRAIQDQKLTAKIDAKAVDLRRLLETIQGTCWHRV